MLRAKTVIPEFVGRRPGPAYHGVKFLAYTYRTGAPPEPGKVVHVTLEGCVQLHELPARMNENTVQYAAVLVKQGLKHM